MSNSTKHFKSFSTLIITIEDEGRSGNIVEIDETNKELFNYYWEENKEILTDNQKYPLDIWTLEECNNSKEEWLERNSGVYCDYYQIKQKAIEDPSAKAIRELFSYYYNYCVILITDGRISYSNKNCYIPVKIAFTKANEEPLYDTDAEDLIIDEKINCISNR